MRREKDWNKNDSKFYPETQSTSKSPSNNIRLENIFAAGMEIDHLGKKSWQFGTLIKNLKWERSFLERKMRQSNVVKPCFDPGGNNKVRGGGGKRGIISR